MFYIRTFMYNFSNHIINNNTLFVLSFYLLKIVVSDYRQTCFFSSFILYAFLSRFCILHKRVCKRFNTGCLFPFQKYGFFTNLFKGFATKPIRKVFCGLLNGFVENHFLTNENLSGFH